MSPTLAVIVAVVLGLVMGFYAGSKAATWVFRKAVRRLDEVHRAWAFVASNQIQQLGGTPPAPLPNLHALGHSLTPLIKGDVAAEVDSRSARR
jgi:hypothetical protein